ncbi:hypothetical protein FA13DRAFT_1775971 [Coprinellus micaceus]|uniref:CHAT domain-containing protein n=1 Tax=Coprinellus micaceus TaxID=71717 RepID=A0A4Y7T2W0_COPMI|nr:hypothetical protein FA13DRAFT_1775971 [Coprinellus micaceus]
MAYLEVPSTLGVAGNGKGMRLRNHGDVRFKTHSNIGPSYLTDITIELLETGKKTEPHPEPAALRFGRIDGPTADASPEPLPLSQVAPQKWKVWGAAQLPPGFTKLDCFILSEGDVAIGRVHLDYLRDTNDSGQEFSALDPPLRYFMSWRMFERDEAPSRAPSGYIPVDDEAIWKLVQRSKHSYDRFRRSHSLVDISEAITTLQNALEITPESSVSLPGGLNNLGAFFRERCGTFDDAQDLDHAISAGKKAVSFTPVGDTSLPSRLIALGRAFMHRFGSLGDSFMRRFERTGELQDITQAISMGSQAVRLTPEGHASLPNTLHNLGNLFLSRFERTNKLEDISEAISLHSKVVHMSPKGNPGLDSVVYDLGNSFLCRFKLTGDLQDLAEAISLEYKAVRLTPDGHVNLPSRLNLLGRLFVKRFQRTGDLQDMVQAISRQSEAIRLIPEGHKHLPSFLNDLGHSLMRRFEATDDLQDLSEAVSVQSRALQLTPEGHEYRSSRLNNLASSLLLLAVKKQDLKDLTKAILLYTEALQLFPDGHATRPDVLGNLANGLLFRFEHEGNIQDIIEAGTMYTEAISLTPEGHADLPLRLCNLGYSGQQLPPTGCPDIRISAATRWAELADRHPVHSQEVVAAFETAIHLLGLIAGLEQTVQRRHSMIQEHTKISLEDAALDQTRLAREWEALLAEVSPYLSPLFSEVYQYRDHVVVINDRCDAIALQSGSDAPLHIPLPLFSLKKAQKGRVQWVVFDRAIRQYGKSDVENEGHVHMVLRSLWDELVKPILQVLGLLRAGCPSVHPLPRIWWCPTGPLSFLPIHAAGNYRGVGVESAMDHVTSSYTLTVTALTKRVSEDHKIDSAVSGIFFTSQPTPHGEDPIPGTRTEVKSIYTKFAEHDLRMLMLDGDEISAAECPTHMEQGTSRTPTLHSSQHARQAQAKIASPDEAVHLAAGMLAAGYRRVVATMWGIGDKYAPKVAEDFYDYLLTHRSGDSERQFDGSLSAHALHHAVQQLPGWPRKLG